MSSQIRTGRHCVYSLQVHLVFITKYRRNVLNKEMLDRLKQIYQELSQSFDAELLEFNGEDDHVHLLVSYPPKVSLSTLVNNLKGVSSRLLRKEFPVIQKYLWKGRLWSRSYYAGSCGGTTLDVIKVYIENQQTPKS